MLSNYLYFISASQAVARTSWTPHIGGWSLAGGWIMWWMANIFFTSRFGHSIPLVRMVSPLYLRQVTFHLPYNRMTQNHHLSYLHLTYHIFLSYILHFQVMKSTPWVLKLTGPWFSPPTALSPSHSHLNLLPSHKLTCSSESLSSDAGCLTETTNHFWLSWIVEWKLKRAFVSE